MKENNNRPPLHSPVTEFAAPEVFLICLSAIVTEKTDPNYFYYHHDIEGASRRCHITPIRYNGLPRKKHSSLQSSGQPSPASLRVLNV